MSRLRLPRWASLLVLPLMAGALLLMHGLDAGATTDGLHGALRAAPTHSHPAEPPAEHNDGVCDDCAAHVMVACVAIVAATFGLRLARRASGTTVSTLVDTATGRIRGARQLLRPPDPAWVRLAVMRC